MYSGHLMKSNPLFSFFSLSPSSHLSSALVLLPRQREREDKRGKKSISSLAMSQLRGPSQVKWGSTRKIRTTDRQYNKRPPGYTDNCDFKSEQSLSPSPLSVSLSLFFLASSSRATGSFFFSYFSLALAHSNDIVALLAAGEEQLSMKWLALNPPCQWWPRVSSLFFLLFLSSYSSSLSQSLLHWDEEFALRVKSSPFFSLNESRTLLLVRVKDWKQKTLEILSTSCLCLPHEKNDPVDLSNT